MNHDKMVEAHFNREELGIMNKLQGGKFRDPHTGLPQYSRLEDKILKNPDMVSHLKDMFEAGNYHKAGYETDLSKHLNQMRHNGRFGDTEIALIPISLAHTLDHMIGGPSINPRDHKREYFLGALMSLASPIIDQIGGALNSITPSNAVNAYVARKGRGASMWGVNRGLKNGRAKPNKPWLAKLNRGRITAEKSAPAPTMPAQQAPPSPMATSASQMSPSSGSYSAPQSYPMQDQFSYQSDMYSAPQSYPTQSQYSYPQSMGMQMSGSAGEQSSMAYPSMGSGMSYTTQNYPQSGQNNMYGSSSFSGFSQMPNSFGGGYGSSFSQMSPYPNYNFSNFSGGYGNNYGGYQGGWY